MSGFEGDGNELELADGACVCGCLVGAGPKDIDMETDISSSISSKLNSCRWKKYASKKLFANIPSSTFAH